MSRNIMDDYDIDWIAWMKSKWIWTQIPEEDKKFLENIFPVSNL